MPDAAQKEGSVDGRPRSIPWSPIALACAAGLLLVFQLAPALGLTFLSGWLPSAQLEQSRLIFREGGNRAEPAVLSAARSAAAGSPLEAQPFYFAAVAAEAEEREDAILPLLDSTLARNPRHYFARLWRARIYYAEARIADAVRELLAVLPLDQRGENDHIAALVDIARDPRNQPLLIALMADDPFWAPAFLRRINAELPDEAFKLALASRSPAAFNAHVRGLVDKGEFERALLLWQENLTPEQLLTFRWPADPTFAAAEADHPLGWRTDPAMTSREREGLYIHYSGRGERRPVAQTLLLGGGFTYRLSITLSGEMKDRGGWFHWDLTCLETGATPARLDVRTLETEPAPQDLVFTLPEEACPAQRLVLTAVPGEYPFAARLTVHEVRISQISRTTASASDEDLLPPEPQASAP